MGTIKMARVDARLIHGQVSARWTNVCAADRIVVLDDETAGDPFLVELFRLGAPEGTQIQAFCIDEGVAAWKRNAFDDGNIIVIFKTVADAFNAYQKGFAFPSLNIGQAPKNGNRRQIYNSVFLDENEVDMLRTLARAGIAVYFHSAPEDKRVSLEEAMKNVF